ncbi:MAG: nucleotidyltransferase domain-containing protein [Bacteroidia bacterium]
MAYQSKFDFSDKKILKNIVSRIVEIANPDRIILFGSRATGKARKDSDYDICVLKKKIKSRSEFIGKIYHGLNVNAPVDIIATTISHFEESKDKWYYVYHDINKEGQVIYEKR